MSYKNRKKKKSIMNQLKYQIGWVQTALLRVYKKVVKKENEMRLPQTRNLTQWLRMRARIIRPNNLRINEWVDDYINNCVLNGKPVDILTQWCLSKDLETRWEKQGKKFIPLQTEIEMFRKYIPEIYSAFQSNGMSINWYITFNNSFLDRGRVREEISTAYITMIQSLVKENSSVAEFTILLDWEKDVLGKRPEPNQEVLVNFQKLVPQQAFEIDFKNLLERVGNYPDFKRTVAELRRESEFKIACEAEEGRLLFSKQSPFQNGDFLLIPLEFSERYVFFEILAPDFQKRITPILKPYPWRMDAEDLKYGI